MDTEEITEWLEKQPEYSEVDIRTTDSIFYHVAPIAIINLIKRFAKEALAGYAAATPDPSSEGVREFLKKYYEWDEEEFEPQVGFAKVSMSDLEQLINEWEASKTPTPVKEDVQAQRLKTDCNVFIDRAIEMLKEDYSNIRSTAGYNGIVSLLGYAKESHLAAAATPEDEKYNPYWYWPQCDVEGCEGVSCNNGSGWRETGYWCLCSKHSQEFREGKPQPKMKQSAIDKEQTRDKITGILP